MTQNDIGYYRCRAEQELGLARLAAHPRAARAHLQLAGHYLDRSQAAEKADGSGGPPTP